MTPRNHKLAPALAGLAALAVADCREDNSFKPPPPPEVGVAHPVARSVTPYLEATGTVAAVNSVDLLARVQGFVEQINYQDGSEVKAGQTLFVIEPAPYQAKYQQAQAAIAAAQAQLTQSDAEYNRQNSLGTRDFASRSTIDQARATRDANQANLQTQQAGLLLAGINLGYTRVNAPFDGVATAHLVSTGDLVGVSGPTKLATIVQLDPIHVNFTVAEPDVQRIRAALAAEGLSVTELGKVEVEIGLAAEQGFPHRGTLDYAAPTVDSGTGTLTARAIVDNKARVLLPGYFARIRIPMVRKATAALLVPDAAIGASQAGRYVLVVGKDGVVQQHAIRAGQSEGALRVVEAGLQPDDDVVISGLARAIPGEKVSSRPAAMPEG